MCRRVESQTQRLQDFIIFPRCSFSLGSCFMYFQSQLVKNLFIFVSRQDWSYEDQLPLKKKEKEKRKALCCDWLAAVPLISHLPPFNISFRFKKVFFWVQSYKNPGCRTRTFFFFFFFYSKKPRKIPPKWCCCLVRPVLDPPLKFNVSWGFWRCWLVSDQ